MADNVVPITASAWGTETSAYDRSEFYTASRSTDGQSVTKSITLPSHIVSQLSALIQSGALPLRTFEDAVRDAIHHRLHDYDEMGALTPEASRRIAIWRRQEELDRRHAEMEQTQRLIKETKEMVETARGVPDMVLLEQVVRDAEDAARDLHEPWKGRLLEALGDARVAGE